MRIVINWSIMPLTIFPFDQGIQKEMTKTCSRCRQAKEISHFTRDSRSKDGHGYTCRECNAAYHKIYKTTSAYRISKKKAERKLEELSW